jgi:hypothetical protein
MAHPCVERIMKLKFAKDVTAKEVETVVNRMADILKSSGEDPTVFNRIANEVLNRHRLAAVNVAKQQAENLIKARTEFQLYNQKAYDGDPGEGIAAMLDGTNRVALGANNSIRNAYLSHQKRFWSVIEAGLDRSEQKLAASGDLDLDILREMEAKGTSSAGLTNNKVALKIAETLNATQNLMLKTLQASGSAIKELPGYLIKQAHDAEKIQKASFDEWYPKILTALDQKATFTEALTAAEKKEFLQRVYDDIVVGKYDVANGTGDEAFDHIGQFANLDKRVSSSRKLHFESADKFFEYNKEFGKGNVYETVYHQVQITARNAALMERLGTNPSHAFNQHMLRAERVARSGGADSLSKFQGKKAHLSNTFDGISGTTTMPGRSLKAKYGAGARSIINISHLGNTAVAATSDLASAAAVIQSSTGKTLVGSYTGLVKDFLTNIPAKNRMEVAGKLRIAISDMIQLQNNRFGIHEIAPGALAEAEKVFFKVSGIELQTQAGKTASALGAARQVGGVADVPFAKLDERLRNTLTRYNITDADWEIARKGLDDIDGAPVITPEAIEALPDLSESVKNKVAMSVSNMYNDIANLGSPTPGPSTQAHLLRGAAADSPWGQSLRFFAQFKQFPVHIMTTVLPRIASNAPGTGVKGLSDVLRGRGDNVVLMNYLFGMTGLGAMVIALTDIENGKTPRVPGFWEAFNRGGAAGLYADIIMGEHAKYNKSVFDALAGPGLGGAATVLSIFNKTVKGDMETDKAFQKLGQLSTRNIPGKNIFYIKAAFDRMFLYSLQESLNPGYLDRIEKRTEEEGQEFFLSRPTEAVR